MKNNDLTLRETARGIAVRTAVLGVGGILLSAVVAAEAMKAAGTLMKIAAGTSLVLIGGGMAAWEVKKVQRRMSAPRVQPAML
jgi:sulfite exporter TauE/SafE